VPQVQKITPCLWFDGRAEEAAAFYVSVFPDSRITALTRYGEVGREIHGQAPGTVLTVAFELAGQPFTALNGGPLFRFTEAISFQVGCDDQDELDRYWERLGAGGDPAARQCGWLKDRYGVSWQVLPTVLPRLLADPDPARAARVMTALLGMTKLDLRALERAHAG
jgi:predicted 3-demethylubiquinone-9 3-methyltransferase (glyoxalase superfamily)